MIQKIDKEASFKQFVFGQTVSSRKPFAPRDMEALISKAKDMVEKEPLPSQRQVLDIFERLARAWGDPASALRREACDALVRLTGFSAEFVGVVMNEFPKMLAPGYLLKKIEGQLGDTRIQEEPVFQESVGIRLIAQPAGLVLHVASGNVFLACIESIIDGIITKNVNILKMSTDDREFPVLFAQSLKECDPQGVIARRLAVLWWPGGEAALEALFKRSADRIVFWGGGEALASWEAGLGESTVLLRHGPKVSFGIISKAGLETAKASSALTDRIATDIAIWEQRACNCPQMIFVEESVAERDFNRFIGSLSESLVKINEKFPPAARSDDEYVEILKHREIASARRLASGERVRVAGPDNMDWTIIAEERAGGQDFETSPLNRTIRIKRYPSITALSKALRGNAFYLQTAGYCLSESEVAEYAVQLSRKGVTRICPFGIMAIPTAGAPHDGGYALRDLTRFAAVE